jgi:hypothetical protein
MYIFQDKSLVANAAPTATDLLSYDLYWILGIS